MAVATFHIDADTSRLVTAFEQAAEYASLIGFRDAFGRMFGTEDLVKKLVRCEVGPVIEGTITVVLTPTDYFLRLLAEARKLSE